MRWGGKVIPEKLAKARIAGIKLNFHIVKGEVVDSKTWSETKINSTSQRSRRTSAEWISDVSSTNTEVTELFLRTPEGNETSARIYNSTAGVRAGNTIALLFANDTVIGLWNKEQNKYWWFNTGWIINNKYFFERFINTKIFGQLSAILFLAPLLLGGIFELIPFSDVVNYLVVFIGALVLIFILEKNIYYKRKKKVKKCVENIFDAIVESHQ